MKPRDYEGAFPIEAPTPYAAWTVRGNEQELRVGGILSCDGASVSIVKYIGMAATATEVRPAGYA